MPGFNQSNNAETRILAVRGASSRETEVFDQLVSSGYDVAIADDAESALSILRDRADAFDVVVARISGTTSVELDFLARLKSDPDVWNKPVIMLTGCDRIDDQTVLLEAGAHFCLHEGIDEHTLRSVVRASVIDGKRTDRIRDEVRDRTSGIGRILSGTFEIQTLEQAKKLSTMLSLVCPDPQSTAIGLSELMTNAIEHGNLGITYDEKSQLLANNTWIKEIERRLAMPENKGKSVIINFEARDDAFLFRIKDEGSGFDPKPYMEIDPARALHAHGRGITMASQFCFDRIDYIGCGNEVIATISCQASK